MKNILINKKVLHNFKPLETFEAGLVLSGPEVKSIKNNRADLKGAYITVNPKAEPTIINFFIAQYPPAKNEQTNYDPLQPKKLLLSRKEINYLSEKQQEKGLTIMPLKVYTKNNLIKMEIGVCKGKKKFDKREEMKKMDVENKMRRAVRQNLKFPVLRTGMGMF